VRSIRLTYIGFSYQRMYNVLRFVTMNFLIVAGRLPGWVQQTDGTF
jgi:hypothetical protein